MTTLKAKVFKDKSGNRLLFPAYIYDVDAETPLETEFWGISMSMQMMTGLEMEPDWLEFDNGNFSHFEMSVGSAGFRHGSAHALIFEGPEYDKMKAETAAEL